MWALVQIAPSQIFKKVPLRIHRNDISKEKSFLGRESKPFTRWTHSSSPARPSGSASASSRIPAKFTPLGRGRVRGKKVEAEVQSNVTRPRGLTSVFRKFNARIGSGVGSADQKTTASSPRSKAPARPGIAIALIMYRPSRCAATEQVDEGDEQVDQHGDHGRQEADDADPDRVATETLSSLVIALTHRRHRQHCERIAEQYPQLSPRKHAMRKR